tara:strand:+ start:32868 stop:33545 length:678 start_codon:yes stop_codon:yes gene_type:complete
MKTHHTNSSKLYFHLFLSIGFAISLVLIRMQITNNHFYIFLIWNLFLAGIPYVISQTMKNHLWIQSSKIYSYLGFIIWLVFLPNSPYIVTDLVHLENGNSNLAWFDLFLVFVFALNGLLLGLLSMLDMFQIISFRYTKRVAFITMIKISLLAGYGIYLGRFLRFNSWDIIMQPKSLLNQIIFSIYDPKMILMTFAFGGFIWILFSLMNYFMESLNLRYSEIEKTN